MDKTTPPITVVRTEVLCPNCMKKKLLTEGDQDAWCDNCLQAYTITGPNQITYKGHEVPYTDIEYP